MDIVALGPSLRVILREGFFIGENSREVLD